MTKKQLLFLDSGKTDEIFWALEKGYINGVTTNPSLCVKAGFANHIEIEKALRDLAEKLYPLPISLEQDVDEFTATKQMVSEGRRLYSFGKNVIVKIPVWYPTGFEAIAALSQEGIPINATLIFRWRQAIKAAQCGAAYVSPFLGRLDDNDHDGLLLIEDIVREFEKHGVDRAKTKILAASIRGVPQMTKAWGKGADIVTVPLRILQAFSDGDWEYTEHKLNDNPLLWGERELAHPLTRDGLRQFHKDWLGIPSGQESDDHPSCMHYMEPEKK